MSRSNLLLHIVVLVTICTSYSQAVFFECGRVNVQNTNGSAEGGKYAIPFNYNQQANNKWVVATSIASFIESNHIGVKVVDINSSSFIVLLTPSLLAFSYIAVQQSSYYVAGDVIALFPIPSPLANTQSLVQSSIILSSINSVIDRLATLEPFISQLEYQQSSLVSKSSVKILWDWPSSSLKIMRSVDVTKVRVSVLIYLKVGNFYLNVKPIDGVSWFNLGKERASIFVGTRGMGLDRSHMQNYIFNMSGSILAEATHAEMQLVILQMKSANCSLIDGITSAASMDNCLPQCPSSSTNLTLLNITICLPAFVVVPSNPPSLFNTAALAHTYYFPRSSECSNYDNTLNYMYCTRCNSSNNFVGTGSGACMCKQGYYMSYTYTNQTNQIQYKDQSYVTDIDQFTLQQDCNACDTHSCPFQIGSTLKVITNAEDSSQSIQIHIYINQQLTNSHPFHTYRYDQLVFNILINGKQPSNQFLWLSNYQAIATLTDFSISNFYEVSISTSNSILLQSEGSASIYLSPQVSKVMYYTRPSPSKLAVTTMEAISSLTPTASLVAALLGAKVNLFNFVQISSMLYLSSFVKWNNFGSLNRITLSQSLFKLEPTNFFATLHINVSLPQAYTHNSILMYCSIFPQYFFSILIQILIIQLIIRILSKLFPSQYHSTGYLIEVEGKVTWTKKSFLGQYIDSYQKSLAYTVMCMVEKAKTKRFIFYTTLVNSQLIYHSYMIFSQFKISVSSPAQIANLFFSLAFLALILISPCIGPHSPLVLLKCIGIVYKKREYTVSKLFLFYAFGIVQLVVYGASIAMFDSSLQQCIGITTIIALKLVLMYKYLKVIQKIKYICLFIFFGLLGFGSYFSTSLQLKVEYLMICLMLSAGLIEILKIIRAVIITILGFFKAPLSIKGKAIVQKVAECTNTEIKT